MVYEAYHCPRDLEMLKKRFDPVDDPVKIEIPRDGNRKAEWMLIRARGYHPGASP